MNGDRGSATVYAAGAGLAVMTMGAAIAMSATLLIARAQARTAADLGALAGAAWAHAGERVACARAATFVADNGAFVVSCALQGLDLLLTVQVRGVRVAAKAGPVRTGGSDVSH